MTFNIGTIQGGTHAGWRTVREAATWTCQCDVERKGYSCPVCGDRRPANK